MFFCLPWHRVSGEKIFFHFICTISFFDMLWKIKWFWVCKKFCNNWERSIHGECLYFEMKKKFLMLLSISGPKAWLLKDTAQGAAEAVEAGKIENIFELLLFFYQFCISTVYSWHYKTKRIIDPKIWIPSFEKKKIDADRMSRLRQTV